MEASARQEKLIKATYEIIPYNWRDYYSRNWRTRYTFSEIIRIHNEELEEIRKANRQHEIETGKDKKRKPEGVASYKKQKWKRNILKSFGAEKTKTIETYHPQPHTEERRKQCQLTIGSL